MEETYRALGATSEPECALLLCRDDIEAVYRTLQRGRLKRYDAVAVNDRGTTMTRITRRALTICAAIALSHFATANSVAQQWCDFSGNCPMPLTCQPGWFGGYCGIQACNADTDCRNGSVCDFGLCQSLCTSTRDCPAGQICARGESRRICMTAPASGGGGGGGSGGGTTRYYIEGGLCGTIRYGQVTKHLGCAPGLRCSNPNGRGTCQKPPA